MGFLAQILSLMVKFESRVRGKETELQPELKNPGTMGEMRMRSSVLAGFAVVITIGLVAEALVALFGGSDHFSELYFLIPATTFPPAAFLLVVYFDHSDIRSSLATSRLSSSLVQIADSSVVTALGLSFSLIIPAWLLEVGIGIATPLRLPGTFAAAAFSLAHRLAGVGLWWTSIPAAAFLLLLLLLAWISLRFDTFFTSKVVVDDDYQPLA